MSSKQYRITILCLSLVKVVIGVVITVLLYYAGQEAIDAFYFHETYVDRLGRIYRKNPADDLIGQILLRGWSFGFLYIIPGILGLATALLYHVRTMTVHLILSIFVLLVGSFVHTAGVIGLILYRVLVNTGTIRYDPVFGDCVFGTVDPYAYPVNIKNVDNKCLACRQALLYAIGALGLFLLGWLFVFSNVLYCAFTYHVVQKNIKNTEINRGEEETSACAVIPTGRTSTAGTQTYRRRPDPRARAEHSIDRRRQHRSYDETSTGISHASGNPPLGNDNLTSEGRGNGHQGNSNQGNVAFSSPGFHGEGQPVINQHTDVVDKTSCNDVQSESQTYLDSNHGNVTDTTALYEEKEKPLDTGIDNDGFYDNSGLELDTVIVQDKTVVADKHSTNM